MKELYSIIVGLAIIFILFVGLCRINKDFRYFALENMGMLNGAEQEQVDFYRQVKTNNKKDLVKNHYFEDFEEFTVDFKVISKDKKGTVLEFYNPLLNKKNCVYIAKKDNSFKQFFRYNLKTKRITFSKLHFNYALFLYIKKNNAV